MRVNFRGCGSAVLAHVDGTLLVDLWDDLVLPASIRAVWNRLVTGEPATQAG